MDDAGNTKTSGHDTSAIQNTVTLLITGLIVQARCRGERAMRDLLADWKKWNSVERLLAVVLVLMLIGLPLRALITAGPL